MKLTKIAKGYGLRGKYECRIREVHDKYWETRKALENEELSLKERKVLEKEDNMFWNLCEFKNLVDRHSDRYPWEDCEKMNGFVEWFFQEYNLFKPPVKIGNPVIRNAYYNLESLFHSRVQLYPEHNIGIVIEMRYEGESYVKVYRDRNIIFEKIKDLPYFPPKDNPFKRLEFTKINDLNENKINISFGEDGSRGIKWVLTKDYNIPKEELNNYREARK